MKSFGVSSFDDRAARAADLLVTAWPQFVSYAELTQRGIDRPAQTVYELELAGYPIEHSTRGVRLREVGVPAMARPARRGALNRRPRP